MQEIIQFIQDHQKFAITSHARPDGDSIGSELGLAFALKQLGKEVDVYNADPHPRPYESLPGIETICVRNRIEGQYDGLFVLECNDLNRPGLKGLDRYFTINIDHHPNTQPFADLNWVNPSAAAVGEMIYDLIKALQAPLTSEAATNLYVAILTDTGSFQYSNTDARTFLVASDLVSSGADPSRIAQQIYMSQPESRIRLIAMLLKTLKVHPSGAIATITLTRDMLEKTGASANDTEGVVNYPLSINGVKLAAFFREEKNHSCRVSLRSKNHYNVASTARYFGGGGHTNAAGLRIEGSLQDAEQKVIARLEQLLEKTEG